MQFGLMFFASEERADAFDKYRLVIEAARFADRHGFASVWVPERHFASMGSLYPNPSVLHAALARETSRIRLRAGSVVLPLHDPIRVAEEWAVVDNLSDGRVDVSFAVGWNPNDFALAPEAYADRVERTFQGIEIVRRLWRGESVETPNGLGQVMRVAIHPLPRQKDLPIWLTCSGGAERFVDAGAHGFNVLTALLFQGVEDLAEKLAAYREAWARHGHPGAGRVTLMLHTFIGVDEASVRSTVREPFKRYLESSVDLWRAGEARLDDLSPRKRADLLEYAFERYYRKTALLGTVASCGRMVESVSAAGVDEIACLVDFGVDPAAIMAGLDHLDELRRAG
jgi:natural product biosynthesis luciferase-like monooxygenase protein